MIGYWPIYISSGLAVKILMLRSSGNYQYWFNTKVTIQLLSSVSSSSSTSARSATLLTLCQDLFKVTFRKTKAPVVQHRDMVTLISYIICFAQPIICLDHVITCNAWTNHWSWIKSSLDKRARKNNDLKLIVKRRLYLLLDFFLPRYWFLQLESSLKY